ncbi:hypothetical protein [Lysobacter fragariae]
MAMRKALLPTLIAALLAAPLAFAQAANPPSKQDKDAKASTTTTQKAASGKDQKAQDQKADQKAPARKPSQPAPEEQPDEPEEDGR